MSLVNKWVGRGGQADQQVRLGSCNIMVAINQLGLRFRFSSNTIPNSVVNLMLKLGKNSKKKTCQYYI